MNRYPDWVYSLDIFSQGDIDVMMFVLTFAVVIMVAILLISQTQEHWEWQTLLSLSAILLFVGAVMSFVDPPFKKYAPPFRMWGVFFMVLGGIIGRWQKMEGWTLVRVGKWQLVVGGIAAVFAATLIIAPFYSTIDEKENLRDGQHTIIEQNAMLITQNKQILNNQQSQLNLSGELILKATVNGKRIQNIEAQGKTGIQIAKKADERTAAVKKALEEKEKKEAAAARGKSIRTPSTLGGPKKPPSPAELLKQKAQKLINDDASLNQAKHYPDSTYLATHRHQ